jgi:hypothetical protein
VEVVDRLQLAIIVNLEQGEPRWSLKQDQHLQTPAKKENFLSRLSFCYSHNLIKSKQIQADQLN